MNKEITNLFLKSIPKIHKFQSDLLSLIKTLERNALTGKISSLHIAETLFEFIDNTKDELFVLEEKLKENLIKENAKKVFLEINSRSQVVIDILIRNLYERSADVGFLSSDRDVIRFTIEPQKDDVQKAIKIRLLEYMKKYTIYDDIFILSLDGKVLVNVNETHKAKNVKESIIQDAINNPKSFVEAYRASELVPQKRSALLFAKVIKDNKKDIGVLVLSIKLEDELNRIFETLGEMNRFIYTLIDDKGIIISSSNPTLRKIGETTTIFLDSDPKIMKANKKDYLVKSSKSLGYEGYKGPKWVANVILPSNQISPINSDNMNIDKFSLEKSNILPDSVKEIQEKWDGIEGDLSDVIINGELIASRLKEYVLNPLLDNIRTISTSIYEVMESAIADIQKTIISSILLDSKFRAKLAINIMDRNLYERANDCRWFAMNSIFREKISKMPLEVDDIDSLNAILKYINSLYTVYTNIFIFEKSGKIIAMSNKKDAHFLGQYIEDPAIKSTLSNKDTQKYFVTEFSKRKFYDNKETYIYSASILDSKAIPSGGVALVFDSTPQFKKMLEDVLPKDKDQVILKGCFALYVDENRKVLASAGDSKLAIGDLVTLNDNFFTQNESGYSEILDIYNSYYSVGSCVSKGYREYKVSDNYKNTVFAIIFTKIEMIHKI